MQNLFLEAVYQYNTYTENGAVSHSTTGNRLLDYFAKAATYRDRKPEAVAADISAMWAESPKITLQILFYLRMITRKTKGFVNSESVQRGQGNRSEFRMAIIWLATYKPRIFYQNLWLVPVVGAWKDLWHEDLLLVLDHEKVYELIKKGLADDYNRDLIAKYLPRLRSKNQVFNQRQADLNAFGYGLCKYLGWSPVEYRKFKSSGKAHTFQQQMSTNQWENIDFSKIAGKALFQMTNNRGKSDNKTILERHGLEAKMLTWLETQDLVKFTGYVYELYTASVKTAKQLSLVQKYSIDKQFDGLVALAREGATGLKENVWCALDTSGSMGANVAAGITAFDICISLGTFFATLNEGAFQNHVIMFDNESRVLKISGTFTDKIQQIRKAQTAWGSTNFQSVIDEIVRIRQKNPRIPIADYPTTLLVVSDMQFNPVDEQNDKTNYEKAMEKLAAVGLPKIRIIWWWVTGRGADFPSIISDSGVAMIGGFDGSIVTQILGGETTTIDKNTGEKRQLNAFENMLKALQQEVLQKVNVG